MSEGEDIERMEASAARVRISGPTMSSLKREIDAFPRVLLAEMEGARADVAFYLAEGVFRDAKTNRVWNHYSPVLVPWAHHLEQWWRQKRSNWRWRKQRMADAWDVLKHGLPLDEEW